MVDSNGGFVLFVFNSAWLNLTKVISKAVVSVHSKTEAGIEEWMRRDSRDIEIA